MIQNTFSTRRCTSNRSSPVRQIHTPQVNHQIVYQSNPKLHNTESRTVRSRSHSRRSKSRSPVNQMYRREIKINIANPKQRRQPEEEEIINKNMMEERIVTTTSKQPQRIHKSTASLVPGKFPFFNHNTFKCNIKYTYFSGLDKNLNFSILGL